MSGGGSSNVFHAVADVLNPVVGVIDAVSAVQNKANKAKNAADMERQDMMNQIGDQKKKDQDVLRANQEVASNTSTNAIAAIRRAMLANSSFGGTILTGPQGASPAPTQSKMLLGV